MERPTTDPKRSAGTMAKPTVIQNGDVAPAHHCPKCGGELSFYTTVRFWECVDCGYNLHDAQKGRE